MHAEHLYIDSLLHERLAYPEQWLRDRAGPHHGRGRSVRHSRKDRTYGAARRIGVIR